MEFVEQRPTAAERDRLHAPAPLPSWLPAAPESPEYEQTEDEKFSEVTGLTDDRMGDRKPGWREFREQPAQDGIDVTMRVLSGKRVGRKCRDQEEPSANCAPVVRELLAALAEW